MTVLDTGMMVVRTVNRSKVSGDRLPLGVVKVMLASQRKPLAADPRPLRPHSATAEMRCTSLSRGQLEESS